MEEAEKERKKDFYSIFTHNSKRIESLYLILFNVFNVFTVCQVAVPGAACWRHGPDGGHAHPGCPAQSAIGFQR